MIATAALVYSLLYFIRLKDTLKISIADLELTATINECLDAQTQLDFSAFEATIYTNYRLTFTIITLTFTYLLCFVLGNLFIFTRFAALRTDDFRAAVFN